MYDISGCYQFPNKNNDWIKDGRAHFLTEWSCTNNEELFDEEIYGIYLFIKQEPTIHNNNMSLEVLNKLINDDILYIGCSGTYLKDERGTHDFRQQNLYGRIVKGKRGKKPFRKSTKNWIKEKMNAEINSIWILWCQTWYNNTGGTQHLPKYVEGILIQEYLKKSGNKLPPWNVAY